mgnify:CR=1 FL=1
MDFFDLHCDTLTQLMQSGGSLWDAPGCHVSLKKASAFGRWAQVYACFVPEGTESGARLIEHADKALYYVKRNSRNAYYIIRE